LITAVDSNVLLDLLIPGAPHQQESRARLLQSMNQGALLLSEAVYAELAVRFAERTALDQFLDDASIRLQPSSREALFAAGEMRRNYTTRRASGLTCAQCGTAQVVACSNCGSTISARQRVLADFLVGAHAQAHADRLLTRDLGYYKTYFPVLTLA
jgi:hypothetical protein